MRIKVSLLGRGKIPYNYNISLAGAIYSSIRRADVDLAYRLHSSKSFKFFTFSQLQAPKRKAYKDGIFVSGYAYFLVSSPIKEIISSIVEGMLCKPEIKISSTKFTIESIEVLKPKKFNGEALFSTLSPVIVRTAKEENGKLKTIDLLPNEEKFYENLKKNLIRKYETLYNEKRDNIDFEKPISTKPKRIQIKNTYHRATHMVIKAKGDSELLKLAYETGLGEKNSMGFGMVKVVR